MILNTEYFPSANAYTYLLILLIGFSELLVCTLATLESVDDSNLVQLITKQQNVIVLFTKEKCQQCDELEVIVDNISNELKENLKATIVKGHNSNMVSLYNPTKEPALVFFRHGVPLLYYGDHNEAIIVQKFLENQEPIVKELSDENFEHLTQAATGATTGDWFVFFYSTDCVTCLRLFAIWEAVGAALKHRVNVARIDRYGVGNLTAKRFNVIESPDFIFLRQGKIYRYRIKEYTPKKMIEFATSEYKKQAQPETVPPEATVMSTLFTDQYDWLANNQQMAVILIVLASVIILAILRRYSKQTSKKAIETDLSKKAK